MSRLSKMSQSDDAKKKFQHPLIDFLKIKRTKAEIANFLKCGQRKARDHVSRVAMYYPVIAVSDKQGYRRAKNIAELDDAQLQTEMEEVEHQLRETNSRIKCLKKKQRPLIAWLRVAQKEEAKRNGSI